MTFFVPTPHKSVKTLLNTEPYFCGGLAYNSCADFERSVLSIGGMHGMSELMLSEPGRTRVTGMQYVMHTNTLVKTGGGLDFGSFHNENYHMPDVPRYVCFFCLKPSWLGGETGLVNTAKVFQDLPTDLQQRLEERSYFVGETPLALIADKYGLSELDVERFCLSVGLPVVLVGGTKHIVMFKPSVIRHPLTGERSLIIHFGDLVDRRRPLLVFDAFLSDYVGLPWLIHRFHWRFPQVSLTTYRSRLRRLFSRALARKSSEKAKTSQIWPTQDLPSVGSAFTPDDLRPLASAMRRRYSSFLWRRGDVLIVDNLQMAHAGMPGFGRRELRALFCNPIVLNYSQYASGLYDLPPEDMRQSLGERLVNYQNPPAVDSL